MHTSSAPPRSDLHIHTSCSPDSPSAPSEACHAAVRRGLDAIAITDHVAYWEHEVGFQGRTCKSYAEDRRIVEELKAEYRGMLTVLLGVEMSYVSAREREIRAFLTENRFEFVIGSIHDSPPVSWWDHAAEKTLKTRPDLARKALSGYYSELRRAAESGLFDAIGHVDAYERYFPGQWPDILEDKDLVIPVRSALEAIARRSRMEVNLAMLDVPGHFAWSALPLLRMYREAGGKPPTLGSDAHLPRYVGLHLEEGERLAREAGFGHTADWREIGRLS